MKRIIERFRTWWNWKRCRGCGCKLDHENFGDKICDECFALMMFGLWRGK